MFMIYAIFTTNLKIAFLKLFIYKNSKFNFSNHIKAFPLV